MSSERRPVHASLAPVLVDQPGRRAWHMGEAAVEPGENVPTLLKHAARITWDHGPVKPLRWEVRSARSTPADAPSPPPELRLVVPECHPKLRNDLRSQPLGMFGRCEQRREQDEFRAGSDDLTQLARTVHRSSRDRGSLGLG